MCIYNVYDLNVYDLNNNVCNLNNNNKVRIPNPEINDEVFVTAVRERVPKAGILLILLVLYKGKSLMKGKSLIKGSPL